MRVSYDENMNENGSELLRIRRVDQKGNRGVKDRRSSHDAQYDKRWSLETTASMYAVIVLCFSPSQPHGSFLRWYL